MIESDILNLINIMLLFQCDVTRSLHRYESPGPTVYWPSAYNSVLVLVYRPILPSKPCVSC